METQLEIKRSVKTPPFNYKFESCPDYKNSIMIYTILKKLDKMGEDKPPFWFWFILVLILLSIFYMC